MKISSLALMPCLSLLLAAQQAPVIGTAAPALSPARWVKGTPITLQKGKLTVVEFWATWCGPCRESIPHLTALARQYQGKVAFVGVNIWERQQDPKARSQAVDAFVKAMGSQMEYAVAEDAADGPMALAWMGKRGQHGIPRAYVVDSEGRIAWAGHPLFGLQETLEALLAGRHDLQAARQAEIRAELEDRLLPTRGRATRFPGQWVVLPAPNPQQPYLAAYVFPHPQGGFGLRIGAGLRLEEGKGIVSAPSPLIDRVFTLDPRQVPVARLLPEPGLKALGLQPSPTWLKEVQDPSDAFTQRMRLASLLNHYGESDLALPTLEQGHRDRPQEEGVLFELAYAYNALEAPQKALAVLKQGLLLHAKSRNLHMELGYVHTQLGQFRESVASYQRALDLTAPDDQAQGDERNSRAEILANLSNAHHQLGDKAQALALLRRAKALAPADHPIQQVPEG